MRCTREFKLVERTLTILKPDCVSRGLMGKVIQRLEEAGFKICAAKMVRLNKESAGGFYEVHRDKPFFEDLLAFMTEGPVIPMILEKDGNHRFKGFERFFDEVSNFLRV